MLYVVVGWTDGFGNDSYVRGIYPTREEAIKHCYMDYKYKDHSDRIAEVDFGYVDLDFYDLPPLESAPKRKKRRE